MAVKRFGENQSDRTGDLTPDFTDEIMHRLGFQRVNVAEARRRQVRRWTGRGVIALAMVSAFGIGLAWHTNSDRARSADPVTLDKAFDRVAREGEATRRAWVRTVDHARRLLPAPSDSVLNGNGLDDAAAGIDPLLPEPDDRSPVPWSGLL